MRRLCVSDPINDIVNINNTPKLQDTLKNYRAASQRAIVTLSQGRDVKLPSREKGRDIPCRMFNPEKQDPITGILMFAHGGGYILNSEKS